MILKTNIHSEEGRQELEISRTFDLPVNLLFKAFIDPEIVAQWMGTKVIKLEIKNHGSYKFETTDPTGNVHGFNGVFHEIIPDKKIIRTFEMEKTSFPVQLEFIEFDKITEDSSKLRMKIIFKSGALRDQMLLLPFAQGINMAHNRLQKFVEKLK